ncbi:MAG TPA: NifU family protein [Bacteroidia bacterium]|nr:NifU family protein [Bacteroidia bacterium]
MVKEELPLSIVMEQTPNPETIKFITNRMFLPSGKVLEFDISKVSNVSPLAKELLQFPFVKHVLITENYVSITKHSFVMWDDILLEVRDFIYQFLNQGKKVIDVELLSENDVESNENINNKEKIINEIAVQHNIPQNEIEQKIIDILNEYILPAVSQDGGFITFESFKDGVVYLKMRGACSGCPSSIYTLKAGIEALLKKMLPDIVKEVRSEGILNE